jgi:hypothetical protein
VGTVIPLPAGLGLLHHMERRSKLGRDVAHNLITLCVSVTRTAQNVSLRVQCRSRTGSSFASRLIRKQKRNMRSSSKVRLNFRVNDLEFEEAFIWPCEENPADFQLVIEHRFLGSFALHEDLIADSKWDGSQKLVLLAMRSLTLSAIGNGGQQMRALGTRFQTTRAPLTQAFSEIA